MLCLFGKPCPPISTTRSKRRCHRDVYQKKKKQQVQLNLHSNSDLIRKGLETYHKGKHLLLVSKYLCKQGQVPEGQEDFLWEYTFIKVNDDCKTGIIEFN